MPYTIDNPPEAVKGLPEHAIAIFVAAYNAAFEQYKGDEAKSAATAWAAVKMKYKQVDGEWVVKENRRSSNMAEISDDIKVDLEVPQKGREAIESLRTIYSDIIQEAGRRNAAMDSARLKKILALCQELLDSEEPEEKAAKEALKEARATLAWLKEQGATKTEDGASYPAAAFAYVPDPETPSGWKLRIWESLERQVTRGQLGKSAAALSPGGSLGKTSQMPATEVSAAKRKIRAEYRRLEVPDEEIPRWVKETESRTIISDVISLAEATISGKGVAQVIIIKSGLNSSKDRYYPAEVLARDYQVFEGVKMYADHPTEDEEKQRPERSIRDWVATLKNVHVDESGQLIGEAVIVEPWMQAKLANLRDQSMLSEMGISINAVGTASKGEIEGVKTNVIERIVRVRSVDFVTEPGAGGMVQIYEADRDADVDLVSLDILRERRPDLVKSIENEVKSQLLQEARKVMESEERIKELETQNAGLVQEKDDLQGKLTEAEKAGMKAEAKFAIDKAVGESELPELARARILEKFVGAESADGITEAIKAESDYIAALTEAGKVKGMGGNTTKTVEAGTQALREALKKTNPEWTDAQLDTAVSGR
ncbi:MAG: ChaB family protein [Gammaproteobacteria bacterium]|nr:ChaB family protein [Gammaproteobacteria bacterium]